MSPSAARLETRRTAAPFTVTSPFSIHDWTRVRVALRRSVQVAAQDQVEPQPVVAAVGGQDAGREGHASW